MITCGGCVHPNTDHSQVTGFCTFVDCDCKWREPTITHPVMLDEGTYCCYCSRSIDIGFPYSLVLTGFLDAPEAFQNTYDDEENVWPMYDILCVYCVEEDYVQELEAT